jgi:hypothetical protein
MSALDELKRKVATEKVTTELVLCILMAGTLCDSEAAAAELAELYEALYHRELARAAQPPAVREYVARLSVSQPALTGGE